MAYFYKLEDRDVDKMVIVRSTLAQHRTERGWTYAQAAQRCGVNGDFIYQLETQKLPWSPRVSTWQRWATAFGLRLRIDIDTFWDIDSWEEFPEMRAYWGMAEVAGTDLSWHRLWLVTALRAWRIKHNIPASVVAARLNRTQGGVLRWEGESVDPLVARVLVHARAVDAEVSFVLLGDE